MTASRRNVFLGLVLLAALAAVVAGYAGAIVPSKQAPEWSLSSAWPATYCSRPQRSTLPTLASLFGASGVSDGELFAELVRTARSRPVGFTPMDYASGHDYAKEAAAREASGWSANGVAPLRVDAPVDWGVVRNGDPNWHFQLNSFRPWRAHSFAAWDAPDGHFADVFLAAAKQWIAFNLLRKCPNSKAWYDMSAGQRAHTFAVLLQTLLLRKNPPLDEVRVLAWALHEHGVVLSDPRLFPRGNHSLFMMLGLRSICHVLPKLRECKAWATYAEHGVERFLERSVSSDFIELEPSPGYHVFAAQTLTSFERTRLFGEGFSATTNAMRANAVWMAHPDGHIVNIGDSEGKLASRMHPYVQFALSDGKHGQEPPRPPAAFLAGGYAVLRDAWEQRPLASHSFVFFSASHHSTIHKHADDGTFEWSLAGREVLVDSGKYTYGPGHDRDFFISTRASSTIQIDTGDLPIDDKHSYGSALIDVGRSEGGIQYAAASIPRESQVTHARVLAMGSGWLLVADRLSSEVEHTYRQWLGFHEDYALAGAISADHVDLTADGAVKIRVLAVRGEGTFEAVRGQLEPLQGWVSHAYQTRVPRVSLARIVRGSDVIICTLLSAPDVRVTRSSEAHGELFVALNERGKARKLIIRFGAHGQSLEEQ